MKLIRMFLIQAKRANNFQKKNFLLVNNTKDRDGNDDFF